MSDWEPLRADLRECFKEAWERCEQEGWGKGKTLALLAPEPMLVG